MKQQTPGLESPCVSGCWACIRLLGRHRARMERAQNQGPFVIFAGAVAGREAQGCVGVTKWPAFWKFL